MDLYTLRYVLSVAEYKSFSLAAQACHVGQPALSQQISKLEKELGVTLFIRSSRGVSLTEAGEEFTIRAREIVQMSNDLKAKMSLYAGVRRGTLNLGIITSLQCIDFGNLLSAFCGSYPGISINIVQGGTYNLLRSLAERTIDAAFLNLPLSGMPPGLEFMKLGEDVYSLAVSSHHPLAGKKRISLKHLETERFIFHQPGQVAYELCLNACRAAGFEPNIICHSSSPTTGLYMVRGGLGVALLPSEDFNSHNMEGIVELELKERIAKKVGMAWRKDTVSPLVDAAISFSKDWRSASSLLD